MPQDLQDWQSIANEYQQLWNFPNCIGSLDGKHIALKAPAKSGSLFYNYKGTHSIILMAIADAHYKLIYIDVGSYGRMSDGGVFNRCLFARALKNNDNFLPPSKPLPERTLGVPYVLIADDAFAMQKHLIKPYATKTLTMLQRVFNYRLSRARRVIENVFGIMASRFRIFQQPIQLDPDKVKSIVLASCALHNYLITRCPNLYSPSGTFDSIDGNGDVIPGKWL